MSAPLAGGLAALIVDVDDTIVDTKGAFARALSDVAATYLPDLPTERHAEVVALWRRDPDGYYRAYTRGEMGFGEQRLARAEQVQSTFGGSPIGAAGFAAWDAVFEQSFQRNWRAHPDARGLLEAAIAAGVRVGAVTNARTEYQERKLCAVGLADLVETVVGVDVFGQGKPDPRIFREACARLGAEPGRCAYIGDELDIDARAATQAGLRGVWLDRPGTRRGGPFDEDTAAAVADGIPIISALTDFTAQLASSSALGR
ncbi:HAD family hydrolase [Rarobacter incanus]|uniref:Putative hydrolase of the HAD superfamily n=1 Tax=Rarobacter incanus TaxID=153494 RepID=A0A542SRK3_9MICO|nr:HAD family hydrolase [Rarobacter incanus]TQK77233.1 putative hydrolase of the HAD superfamily [Rarobacter incanus]